MTSQEDASSMNIRRKLLDNWDWNEIGQFEGMPILERENFLMIAIPEIHLFRNDIDKEVSLASNRQFDVVIFASRHRAESKIPTLTVHPIGNYSVGEYGGKDRRLVPASPSLMSNSLRLVKELGGDLGFTIAFEVTHHGPYLETPSFFIEIGSDESQWENDGAARVLSEVIMNAESGNEEHVLCVGGGHYAPRFTDLVMEREVAIAHMAANYATDTLLDEAVMREMILKSGNPKRVYFHRKSMPKPKYRELKERFEAFGLEAVRSEDFPVRGKA